MISLENGKYPKGVHKIFDILDAYRCDYEVYTFEKPAHHARQAAKLVDCPLGAVVKSIVFKTYDDNNFFLVLISGNNRADSEKLRQIIGSKVHPANPRDVKVSTGYPVGSVPPFGFDADIDVIIDADLMANESLWASAGSENVLIRFSPTTLLDITGVNVCDIKQV